MAKTHKLTHKENNHVDNFIQNSEYDHIGVLNWMVLYGEHCVKEYKLKATKSTKEKATK